MAVTPNTVLYLLKSPIELDNLNQLTFANKEAQANYFLSLPQIEVNKITYQRKDNVIRFPAHIDSIMEYNYVMYQNSNYGNKWFYAFIINMEYANDGMTLITIKTDVFQTWQFDIDVKRSFVVREHTNNDTVGVNTVPEGMEKGNMIQTNMTPITYLKDLVDSGSDYPENYAIVVASTIDLTVSTYDKLFGEAYQGLYSGVSYYCFETAESVNRMLRAVNQGSQTQVNTDIVSIFMVPRAMLNWGNWTADEVNTEWGKYYVHKVTSLDVDSFRGLTYTVNKPTSIDGYTPRNKKLLTGEFNSLNVTNFVGKYQNYRYELFTGNNAQFKMRAALSPSCPIFMYPVNYLNATDQQYGKGCYGIEAPPMPLCNWNTDQYTNWLASTAHTREVENIQAGVEIVMGAGELATSANAGDVGGAWNGVKSMEQGVYKIAKLAAEKADHQKDGNANNGTIAQADTNYTSSKVFGAYQYCIRAEFARRLDSVFDVIGYRTDTMKVPNITGRRNWNYVQTQAVSIQGTIPQLDLEEIKQMFDSGVTFWHNPATFLDYSQNNDII